MKTLIKLFLMTHLVPVPVENNFSMTFYKVVAKRIGRRCEARWYGFVMV